MSSSTAAIAANSALNVLDTNLKSNPRKRITEKKLAVETVVDGENLGKDGKDFRPVRDNYSTPKHSPKRKKLNSKIEKPRWKKILCITIKNSLLLAALFLLGRILWKRDDLRSHGNQPLFTAPAMEEQITDVKKTTEILQSQLQVVEGKIEREIASVKEELEKVIKQNRGNIEKKLEELNAKGDRVEASLIKLSDSNFLSKEELPRILDELKISSSPGDDSRRTNFDEIRKQARVIIMNEIEKHAADGLGMVDFALASGGARVVKHSEAFSSGNGRWISIGNAFRRGEVHPNAQKMLQPSFGEPGQCFALQGSAGFVEIKLRTAIIPEAVTLEHVSKSVGYDRSSAPKECRISAWYVGDGDRVSTPVTVAEFMYDLDKMNVQTVGISSGAVGTVNMVRLDFLSNHGNAKHTCLYRLRAHGSVPNPI
ncbi:SUN domain-containing protein 2-like [Wolffia australiana]